MALEIARLTWPNIFISTLIICHQYDDHHAVRKSHDMKIIQRIFDGDVLDLFLVDITSDNHYKQATSFKRYILREEFPYCIKCYENVFANNYIIVDICIFIICIYCLLYAKGTSSVRSSPTASSATRMSLPTTVTNVARSLALTQR